MTPLRQGPAARIRAPLFSESFPVQIALAPMEGLVDEILRELLTEVGGVDWCVSEFVRVCDRLLPLASFRKLAPELDHGWRTASGTRSTPWKASAKPWRTPCWNSTGRW